MIGEPFRNKTVEKRERPSLDVRRRALEEAQYNVIRIPADRVYLDVAHFRGMHAMSDQQWAGMMIGDEAYAGSQNFKHILETARELFGISWVVPVHRGRGARNLIAHAYFQEGGAFLCGPLSEVERIHFTRFGAEALEVPHRITEHGLAPDLDSLQDILEDAGDLRWMYWNLSPDPLGKPPADLEAVAGALEMARTHQLFTILDVSSVFSAAYRWLAQQGPVNPEALRAQVRHLAERADLLVFNAREDGLTHTGALIMGKEEEDYLKFRTYVVVFEGLHTYGGLAGRDMEALARGLKEATDVHLYTDYYRRLSALADALRHEGLQVVDTSLWGIRLPVGHPTRAFSLAAGFYLLSGVRAGVHLPSGDLALWYGRRRFLQTQLDYIRDSLLELARRADHLPDLDLLNRPATFFAENAHFEPTAPFLPDLQEEVLDIRDVEPYQPKHVEMLPQTTRDRREQAIREAGYNTFLLDSADITIDLLTDSGTSAMSEDQWAEVLRARESTAPTDGYEALRAAVEEILTFPYVVPTHQGRAAEHTLSQVLIHPGQYVINNMYFTTTREHQERAGGVFVDMIVPEAHDPENPYPFKGDMDLDRLEAFIKEKGPENIAYVCLETNVNMAGGQPVSLKATRRLAELCHSYDIPLIFDATRCAENAYMIKMREEGQQDRSVRDILRELLSYGDGLTFSAKKDPLVNIGGFLAVRSPEWDRRMERFAQHFEGEPWNGGLANRDLLALARGLREMVDEDHIRARVEQTQYLGQRLQEAGIPIVVPVGGHAVYLDARRFFPHLPQSQFPAQRLAAEIFVESGVRTMERGTVSAGRDPETGDHRYPKLELVRITIPRRVYSRSHMDQVVEGILGVWNRRDQVPGLRMVYEPPTLRFFTARFESL